LLILNIFISIFKFIKNNPVELYFNQIHELVVQMVLFLIEWVNEFKFFKLMININLDFVNNELIQL